MIANFHHTKPKIGQWVYFIGPNALEILGRYVATNSFCSHDGNLRGYCAKYWRPLSEVELESLNIEPEPDTNGGKRRYIKKSVS